jgi:predicted methyltransferase
MRLKRRTLLAVPLIATPAFAVPVEEPSLAAAIASPLRGARNKARDRYRHPAALLAFFGLTPTESVLEIEPGGGYWTEILAPYLARRGLYTAALPTGTPEAAKETQAFLNKLNGDQAVYGDTRVILYGAQGHLGAPDSYDLILSFRNLHDWMADGTAPAMLAGIHAALKPGGVFGIEDHRAPPSLPQDPKAKNGYVREDYAISLIEAAGLKQVARSEIGANPRDTKNYPDGVWDLPPTLRQGEMDRGKYLAIGESDRWTLKFSKLS